MSGRNIARNGDLSTTGHACDSTAAILATCQTVFVNGTPIARIGDPLVSHNILIGDSCVPHIAYVKTGSINVYAEGKNIARLSDSADQGSIIQGSRNCYS